MRGLPDEYGSPDSDEELTEIAEVNVQVCVRFLWRSLKIINRRMWMVGKQWPTSDVRTLQWSCRQEVECGCWGMKLLILWNFIVDELIDLFVTKTDGAARAEGGSRIAKWVDTTQDEFKMFLLMTLPQIAGGIILDDGWGIRNTLFKIFV